MKDNIEIYTLFYFLSIIKNYECSMEKIRKIEEDLNKLDYLSEKEFDTTLDHILSDIRIVIESELSLLKRFSNRKILNEYKIYNINEDRSFKANRIYIY